MLKYVIAFFLLLHSSLGYSQKTVQVVWPFAVGSSQANMIKTIIDNANNNQDKYKFIFVSKPGAGGAVAANFVKENKDLTVLASSSSFYIRPLLYSDSHNVDNFNLISLICNAQPLAIYSKKIETLHDLERQITLGVLPGSITTLVSRAIARENPKLKIIEVPYKGTPEATTDMLGKHIDGSVDFIGVSVSSRFDPEVKILGITGKRTINGFKNFQSLGINGLSEVTNDYMFFVPKNVEENVQMELNSIFSLAQNDKFKILCEEDFGYVEKKAFRVLPEQHNFNKSRWQKLTINIQKQ